MPSYTVKQIKDQGSPIAMAMLIQCLGNGEPFVTYGSIAREMETSLDIDKIFSTQVGSVVGAMMDKILEIKPYAPLINVLVTRPSGIPGIGAGSYLAERYDNAEFNDWGSIPRNKKLEMIAKVRAEVREFDKWAEIFKALFGQEPESRFVERTSTEEDGRAPDGRNYGGKGESDEHKKLKKWVAQNPRKIGLSASFGAGDEEFGLLSGDSIDVLFSDGNRFVAVEVKSIKSNNDDLQRGIYQCVKYRAVLEAQELPVSANVEALLVTERKLPGRLQARARLLKLKHKCVLVNGTGD